MGVRASNKRTKNDLERGKIHLGINYEGIELAASNLTRSPNHNASNRVAHSIEVNSSNTRKLAGSNKL